MNTQAFNIADSYMNVTFGEGYHPFPRVEITDAQGKAIADAFIEASKDQYTQEALQAYAQFKKEVYAQYQWLTLVGGVKVLPWLEEGQPYANSQEVYDDVLNNNRLYFFLTSEGFGDPSVDYSNHPLLEKTGIVLEGIELCYNDLFRVVHDYFGHCIMGHQFGPIGETNAWLSHLAMFHTLGARRALSTEAQGQTCWFNYGPHLRRGDGTLPKRGDSDYTPLQDRPYAEQVVTLLPVEVFEPLTGGEVRRNSKDRRHTKCLS